MKQQVIFSLDNKDSDDAHSVFISLVRKGWDSGYVLCPSSLCVESVGSGIVIAAIMEQSDKEQPEAQCELG